MSTALAPPEGELCYGARGSGPLRCDPMATPASHAPGPARAGVEVHDVSVGGRTLRVTRRPASGPGARRTPLLLCNGIGAATVAALKLRLAGIVAEGAEAPSRKRRRRLSVEDAEWDAAAPTPDDGI